MRIKCNKKHMEMIYKKHLRYPILELSYSYNEYSSVGFVYGVSIKFTEFSFQMRNNCPCFFEITKGDIRYELLNPEGMLYKRLKKLGTKAAKRFWKGTQL